MNEHDLHAALNTTMPFGKYKGRKLIDLPEPYLVWFHREGFPQGKLGEQLADFPGTAEPAYRSEKDQEERKKKAVMGMRHLEEILGCIRAYLARCA